MSMRSIRLVLGALALCLQAPAADAAVTFTNLYNFAGPPGDGYGPVGTLARGADGVLYGVTAAGGANSCAAHGEPGCGTVFALTPPASPGGAWSESILWNFGGSSSDGILPMSGVVVGPNGTLYGATPFGGNACASNGCGVVFSLTPPASPGGAWAEAIPWEFGSAPGDGETPYALAMGGGGVLYGVTGGGGAFGAGAVFSLTPPPAPGDPWTEAVIFSFGSSTSGGSRPVGLVTSVDGTIYGVATLGGRAAGCCGVVFSLTPPAVQGDAWTEKVLYAPNSSTGTPTSVTVGPAGALYVTTSGDTRRHGGCVLALTPPGSQGASWNEERLWTFPVHGRQHKGPDGYMPSAVTVDAGTGKLFGTTFSGGRGLGGTVFSLAPPASPGGKWTLRNLHKFGLTGGRLPSGGLVRVAAAMYGLTEDGGAPGGYGTAYAITP